MDEKIGVYVCECGPNIKNALDVEAVVRAAGALPGVAAAKSHRLLCSDDGKAFLKGEIKAQGLTRLVIAACSPREHETTFRGVCEGQGLNPFLMQMANIREHAAWVTGEAAVATAKAKAFVAAAVRRVALHQPLERKFVDSNPDALVVGGGVAGISAVGALAQKGRRVALVERAPCLGGRVARFEDAFPRAECASCMMEPKLDKILHKDNVQVLTYSEVEEVLGSFGNYIIKVRRKARGVDLHNCIGCGACYEPCPVQVPNEYDERLSQRKAIYIPYTGCLPNVPVIDREACLRFKGDATPEQRGCDLCQKACAFDAIDYTQQDEVLEIRAGGVVLATGSSLFDPRRAPQYGYGTMDDVLTSMEFARLVSQTGPTGGKVLKKDGQPPQAVAVIHCVGSRTPEHNPYCSGVCCLASLGFTHMIQKHLPRTEVSHVYSELSLPGRDGQKLYDEVKARGARFLRARGPAAARVEREGGRLAVRYETEAGRTETLVVDMVVLAQGLEPQPDADQVSRIFETPREKDGFFTPVHASLDPVATPRKGVFMAGCCQSPQDIPASAAAGGAAAGAVLSALVPGEKLELEAMAATVDPELCAGCKICIGLCPYKAISYDKDKKVAVFSDMLCQACGTCVAACPSGHAVARHFTTRELLAEIQPFVADAAEPKLVAFLCNWCSYAGGDKAAGAHKPFPANMDIIRVMCSGRVDPQLVLDAFRKGADGVLILGCHPGDCHYKEGNYKALRRYHFLKKSLQEMGIAGERFRLEWVSASEGERFAQVVAEMAQTVKKLGPLELKAGR